MAATPCSSHLASRVTTFVTDPARPQRTVAAPTLTVAACLNLSNTVAA
jgi:tRNA(Leu) C34 or U34 (ribose-2'-O)-methylase TrmL